MLISDGPCKESSRRSKLSVEDQNREYAVLNYLESGEPAKTAALRSATGANKAFLDAMRATWQFLPQHFTTSTTKKTGRDKILRLVETMNQEFQER